MYNACRIFSTARRRYGVHIGLPTGGSLRMFPDADPLLGWRVGINQSYPVGNPEAWQQFAVSQQLPDTLAVTTCVRGVSYTNVLYQIEPPDWAELIAMIRWVMRKRSGVPAVDWLLDKVPYPFEEVLRATSVWVPDPDRLQPVPTADVFLDL